jgi:CRP-like cAMP-binding protein
MRAKEDAAGRAPAETERFRNHLLAALPPDELADIVPHLERIDLERRELLHDAQRRITHVHFIEDGIASVLSVVGDGSAVETATIGREGMIGFQIFHGVDVTSEQAMMQVPGSALRVRAETFHELLPSLPMLEALLHRFSVYMFTFAAQNSGCNRKHAVEQRCARWLLTVHDRLESDDIALTHDFVSQMLGVRRASVTDTLSSLERQGLIKAGRNKITVIDRPGLERVACECYRIIACTAARLLEGRPTPNPLDWVETARDGFSTVGDGTPIARSLDEPGRA